MERDLRFAMPPLLLRRVAAEVSRAKSLVLLGLLADTAVLDEEDDDDDRDDEEDCGDRDTMLGDAGSMMLHDDSRPREEEALTHMMLLLRSIIGRARRKMRRDRAARSTNLRIEELTSPVTGH